MSDTTGSIESVLLLDLFSSMSSKFQVYPVDGRYRAQTLNAEHAPVKTNKQTETRFD